MEAMELPLSYHSDIARCNDCSYTQRAQKEPPVVISKTITNALAPSSPWYLVFWPIIIGQATECQRWRCLRQVNRFFASIDRSIISDKAKEFYFSAYQQKLAKRFPKDMGLKLDRHGEYWASWGSVRTSFETIDNFLGFCALADVDLDAGVFSYDRFLEFKVSEEIQADVTTYWVFVSRSRDLLFETGRNNPLRRIEHEDDEENACYVRNFGITGAADKVKLLLEYALTKMGWAVEWGERFHV